MAELLLREGNKVKFKVVVPAADVNTAFEKITNALVRQVRIDGFRPGKAPKSVIEKRVGSEFVNGEVVKELVEQNYPKAIKELSLIPVEAKVDANADQLEKGTAFEFTVDAENYPDVVLPNWEGFGIEAKTPEVTDEDVQKALAELQQSRAKYEQVERAAEAEDLLTVEMLEGEDEGKTLPVYLERAEVGVRNALLGQNAGAEVEVTISGSDEGEDEETDVLRVKILDIKQKVVPAIDEEFVKGFELDSVDTVEALTTRVRTDLEAQAVLNGKQAKRDEFVTKLGEGSQLEIPQVMIDRRKGAMLQDLEEDLKKQSITLKSYVEYLHSQDKLAEFEADMEKSASLRVRNDLALEKLTEVLGTKLEEAEFSTALRNYAVSMRTSVPNLLKALGDEGVENFRVIATRDKALEAALSKLGA
jgi:trigger factor